MTTAPREAICGFVVVRKPEFATAADDGLRYNMSIGSLRYRGMDRLPWEDFE